MFCFLFIYYLKKNKQSRSKCLLQLQHSTQTPGPQAPTNNQPLSAQHFEEITQATTNTTHQHHHTPNQSWIKRDRLLSETNSFSLLNLITSDTMTKAMDTFSDGNSITESGLNAFNVELMTPLIGKFLSISIHE